MKGKKRVEKILQKGVRYGVRRDRTGTASTEYALSGNRTSGGNCRYDDADGEGSITAERTEKLQNDTIKLITERLNAHDKALLELKREQKRGENPRYESPGYNPPPQPRPSTRRESGFPAGFRMFIGTREVFSEDEALGEAIAQCLRYNRGEGPRPKVEIRDEGDQFEEGEFGDDVKIVKVVKATPSRAADNLRIYIGGQQPVSKPVNDRYTPITSDTNRPLSFTPRSTEPVKKPVPTFTPRQ